jgi:mannosyltransferase OCH1-like enzyme
MIPKIFHHTWPSGGIFKPRFAAYRESFMRLHPDWTFMFWTCEDRDKYALSDISRYLQSPEVGLHWIVLSDIMRHEILYKYGGVYLDTDTEAAKNFDCFLDNESFAGTSHAPNTIGNGVIGTVPGNPLFKEIAESVTRALIKHGSDACQKKPEDTVGVNFAGMFLQKIKKIYPQEYFYPFRWDGIEKNKVDDKLSPSQRLEELHKKFPESYSIHWWSGMDADGWTKQRLK